MEEDLLKNYRKKPNLSNFQKIEDKYFKDSKKCIVCNGSIYWNNIKVYVSN